MNKLVSEALILKGKTDKEIMDNFFGDFDIHHKSRRFVYEMVQQLEDAREEFVTNNKEEVIKRMKKLMDEAIDDEIETFF